MQIEFIISTFQRPRELKCMLSSLIAQTKDNWKAIVAIDNPLDTENIKLVYSFNDERIGFLLMNKRWNDWGHTPHEIAKQVSGSDYIIMTNDDNYYCPILIEELNKVIIHSPGMVYWDMMHSHFNYQYFQCTPFSGQIDMGAFATKTSLAKQIPLTTKFDADGQFVEDFKRKFPNEEKVKINKVMFVHN